ncbi:MAG: D-glycero-beta-D-manno-heptose-7-phosphate kinase [Alphaproteobacteria bacterium]|nr:D-glycero-beta-D-manno-heptose-7-phosphate kinase [Alphaproteobacteria bacterium]
MPAMSLESWIAKLHEARLLVAGDVMLDRYVHGTVERISYEAPIPIVSVVREESMPGGAGNVARNVAALGARVVLVGLVGEDAAGEKLAQALAGEPLASARLIGDPSRPTTEKIRYIAAGQQLLRADRESTAPAEAEVEARLIAAAKAAMGECDLVILSDYAKGALTPRVLQGLIAAARAAGRPVVVDPKSRDLSRYAGADLLKPNARELAAATGLPAASDAEIEAAARAALAMAGADAMLVTRAERGMSLVRREGKALHLPAETREIFDVSGAGDTVVACLGAALALGAPPEDAARLASLAAGIVVGKVGTAVAHRSDLLAALRRSGLDAQADKILDAAAAADRVARWRAEGLRIGFTNGCFDLIHPGHLALIGQARAACDRLVLAINDDASVARLKGPGRPVQPAPARASVLAALEQVDLVVVFAEDTPLALLERLRPDVLVKGGDYELAGVVGGDLVRGWGGEVLLADFVPGFSTSATIAKLAR